MNDKLVQQRQQAGKAKSFLERVLAEPENEIQRAATIQAFEMLFELAWKYMKTLVEQDGGETPASPKAVIREAGRHGYIDNPDQWLEFLLNRNLSSHTYVEAVAEKVYQTAKTNFLESVNTLLEKTKSP